MGRPRGFWVEIVNKLMYQYPNGLKKNNSLQSACALWAISQAIEETATLIDGDERVRFISTVYFDDSKRIKFEAQADFQHVSQRTAQRWAEDFRLLVAQNLGYVKK